MDGSAKVLINVDDVPQPTQNELSRQAYVSELRRFIMTDLAKDMRSTFDAEVEPAFQKSQGRKPESGREVHKALQDQMSYKIYSSMRYNAQEMVWESVREEVERALPELNDVAKQAETHAPAGGTLTFNPDLEIPKAVSSFDVHLMPGCYHVERADGDIGQGALFARGGKVFGGGLKRGRSNKGGVADSIAHFLKLRYPDFKPKRILDIGCTSGRNLVPFKTAFPDAELYGIDVGAPMLRYGHARYEAMGVPVHFSQQNAEAMDFEDGFFDLIVSSFFFHEVSVNTTKKVLAECNRLLSDGGWTIHMELPPSSEADPYYNFYLDWDAYYNNEPHYAAFRAQSFEELLMGAGFGADKAAQLRIPDRGVVSDEEFLAFCKGDAPPPAHGNFASYFLFGAVK